MTAGLFYQFAFSATNIIDESDISPILRFAVADAPSQPASPVQDLSQTTRTSITMTWTAVADTQTPGGDITGYLVYMDDG